VNKANSKIVLITYADAKYQKSARTLEKRAKSLGFSDTRVLGPSDLSADFVAKNEETLGLPRGAGYWVWKPWIIDATLKSLEQNQTLLYCDAGVLLRNPAGYFEELAKDTLIHLWSPTSPTGTNNYWIDKSVWNQIVCSGEVDKNYHYWAGMVLSQNNEAFRQTISMWLELCQIESLLRPDSSEGYLPSPGLIGHRHDQSILNCILSLNSQNFALSSLDAESVKSPVIIHRRGNVVSYFHGLSLLFFSKTSRKIIKSLPRKIRTKIHRRVISIRRPNVTVEEVDRHIDLFFK
jgi:hypothetical protein